MDNLGPRSPSIDSTTSDLLRASSTINDLTRVLASVSRSTTPDGSPPTTDTCCCGRDTCPSILAWTATRAKLEKRLVLSAEVGQALLQRHDAYVRQQEAHANKLDELQRRHRDSLTQLTAARQANDQLVSRMSDLAKQKGKMEKRMSQSQLNLDVADASNRSLLHEVAETRTTVNKLHHQQTRLAGLESRLEAVTQERDDLRDEYAEQVVRTRAAESRAASLAQRCEDLESSLERLRLEREAAEASRSDMLQELVQDARLRLESLRSSMGHGISDTASLPSAQTAELLESLVGDNEALKRDTAELRNMLLEAREGWRLSREEMEELRAAGFGDRAVSTEDDQTRVASPPNQHHRLSMSSFTHNRKASWGSARAPLPYRPSEPLTPNASSSTPHSPRPPPRAVSPVFAAFAQAQQARRVTPNESRAYITPDLQSLSSSEWMDKHDSLLGRPPSRLGSEFDAASDCGHDYDSSVDPPKTKRRQLMLLSRSRGVQTDDIVPASSPVPAALPFFSPTLGPLSDDGTPIFGRSRTATMEDNSPGRDSQVQTLPALISRISGFMTRLNQADIPTLTQRLKRQRLAGDVRHLSRSTVKGVLNEVANLRPGTFSRDVLAPAADESILSRNDLRALLKLCKDLLTHLAHMRETINDVVLDPSSASKLRDQAFGVQVGQEDPRSTLRRPPSTVGWIAPISKFFGQTSAESNDTNVAQAKARRPDGGLVHPAPRLGPKLSAEVAASVTTVNVEFTGSGIMRRAVSTAPPSASQLPPSPKDPVDQRSRPQLGSPMLSAPESTLAYSRPRKQSEDRRDNLRSIFAGARSTPAPTESWVVLPRPRQAHDLSATVRARNAERLEQQTRRLSTHVDAVIDSMPLSSEDQPEFQSTLLERTLRKRGLSDSSLHTTFLAAPVNRLISPASLSLATSDTTDASPTVSSAGSYNDRQQSMLHAIGRRVHSLTAGVIGGVTETVASPVSSMDETASPSQNTSIPQIVVRKSSVPQPINIQRGSSRSGDVPSSFGSSKEESYFPRSIVRGEARDF